MIYLLGEIFICVVVAGLLGLVVGWLLKQWLVGDVVGEWRTRLGEAEERSQRQDREARDKIRALHDDLEARAVDITRLHGENEAAIARHESEREGLTASIDDLRKELDVAAASLVAMESDRTDLRGVAGELQDKLNAATGRVSDLETELRELRGTKDELQNDLNASMARAGELEGELETLRAAKGELQRNLDEAASRAEGLHGELDGMRAANGELQQKVEKSATRVAELEGEQQGLSAKVNALAGDLDSARSGSAALAMERDEIDLARGEVERRSAAQAERIGELERELAEARAGAESIESGWRTRWDEQAARLAEAESAAAASAQSSTDRQAERDELGRRLERCRTRRDELERSVQDLRQQLDAERGRVAGAVADVRRLSREMEMAGAAEPAKPRGEAAGSAASEATHGKYGAYVSNRDGQHYFRFMMADGTAILRSEGYTSKRACENGIQSVLKNGAREGGIKRKVARNGKPFFQVVAINGQIVGVSRMFDNRADAERAIALFDEGTEWRRVGVDPPKGRRSRAEAPKKVERDDLKQIHGIGPVLERLLNQNGVHRFAEIAAWTSADIERFAAELETFPGRIERDDWVGGAKRQHVAKYGKKS